MGKICTFAGHSNSWQLNCDINSLCFIIEESIIKGFTIFYVGNRGDFDKMVFNVLDILKEKYPHIKIYEVLTYYNYKHDNISRETIYLSTEKVFYKNAVTRRNQIMVEESDLLICCVKYKSGGAYNTYKYALKLNKDVINLYTEELL